MMHQDSLEPAAIRFTLKCYAFTGITWLDSKIIICWSELQCLCMQCCRLWCSKQ